MTSHPIKLKVVVDTTEADALVDRLKGVAAEIRAENDRREKLLDRDLSQMKAGLWWMVALLLAAVLIAASRAL